MGDIWAQSYRATEPTEDSQEAANGIGDRHHGLYFRSVIKGASTGQQSSTPGADMNSVFAVPRSPQRKSGDRPLIRTFSREMFHT